MIHHQMEFHNVAELETVPHAPGLRLQRFPREIREKLGTATHQRGRFVAQASTGCEIRFVTTAAFIRIGLTATVEDGDVLVYNGDYFHSMHRLKTGVLQTLHLEKPSRFDAIHPSVLQQGRFAPHVWRIVISRNYYPGLAFQVAYHHVETFGHAIRPPRPEELPARSLIAYGSSITHGSGATVQHQGYIQQAARRLGVDLHNKGIGGSCLCEPEMAEYLAEHGEWDIATLELGVNMRGIFTPDEFEQRALYLVQRILKSNPGKPVVLISIFPNSADYLKDPDDENSRINEEFIQRLKHIYECCSHPDLHYVNGHSLLTDFSALTNDLIHPSDYGHTLIGQRLAEELTRIGI